MSNEFIPVPGITAADGTVPVYSPNARWSIWNMKEIYTGAIGTNRYVPKVGDMVLDVDFMAWYVVAGINEVTFIPELVLKENQSTSVEFTQTDILLGVGPGTPSDTYRVYINKNVIPYTLDVEHRLKVNGSMARNCKIFRGADLTNEDAVVSRMYDNNDDFLGTVVPLELIAMDGNIAIHSVPTCYTNEDLPDGEIVTLVAYSDTGRVVSKRQLLVENTSFIRSPDMSVKYVVGISLKSPFMSETDAARIDYPINVPLSGMFLTGVVHYSDGATLELPVDGSKFSIFGFDAFIATIIGQKEKLTLKYTLSDGEVSYSATDVLGDRFMMKTYQAQIVKADGAYTVKLFGYPHWVDGITGYRMEWFLYNLERNINFRVTPYVKLNQDSQSFDPLLFGTKQRLGVNLNLQDANPMFSYYRHVQVIDVTLRDEGGVPGTSWTVGFSNTQNPIFGNNNSFKYHFINENLKELKVDMDLVDQAEWLDRLYYQTLPLVNPYNEINPIVPDWFALIAEDGTRYEFQLANWHQTINISNPIHHGSTMFIEFFKRTAAGDLKLAVAGVPVQSVATL